MLASNPLHPTLYLHKLKGTFSDVYLVSLDMKYEIRIDIIIKDDQVLLKDIGDRDSMY